MIVGAARVIHCVYSIDYTGQFHWQVPLRMGRELYHFEPHLVTESLLLRKAVFLKSMTGTGHG